MEHGTRLAEHRHLVAVGRPGLRILPAYPDDDGAADPNVLRVLVAGSAPLIRGGLRAALEPYEDLVIAGECTIDMVATAVAGQRSDVLLLNLGGEDATACAAAVRTAHAGRGGVRVVALGSAGTVAPAGADCILPPSVTPSQLASAIRMVAAGYRVLGPAGEEPVTTAPACEADGLSRRERDVLTLIARGLSNAEIARELTLSEHTVKSHVQNLLAKLDVPNRLHAVIYAYESGLCGRSG